MALTLNQVIKRVESLALSHAQIKWFYFGDPYEFDTNGEVIYPACFLEWIPPGVLDRTEHLQRFNFRIYLLSLVGVSTATEENETEVLSDMSSIAADILAMLMNSEYQYDWVISPSNNLSPLTESLGDMVAGVFVDVGISVDFFADRCQVPSDDITFETEFDMPRTRIYTYEGTGLEGSSFAVSTINGKHVLAAWRAGFYKRVIATVPDDSEEIKVGSIDVGSGKGILGDGTAVLQTGDGLLAGEKVDFLYYY